MQKETGRLIYSQDPGGKLFARIGLIIGQVFLSQKVFSGNVLDKAKELQEELHKIGIKTTLTPLPTARDVNLTLAEGEIK